MSAALSVFKLSVQSVCQLQQHTIEVSFKMTGLPYPGVGKLFMIEGRMGLQRACHGPDR